MTFLTSVFEWIVKALGAVGDAASALVFRASDAAFGIGVPLISMSG